jgi:hypothetical protein
MAQVTFDTFLTKLQALQKAIKITSPAGVQGKETYWGATMQAITDLPCIVNALTESDRVIGFGTRDQKLRVNVQCFVAKAETEPARSSRIATALWFAAKDAFDKDITIGGTVSLSVLRGGEPTVPVILTHAGQAYIGFDAYLDIEDVEGFTFG